MRNTFRCVRVACVFAAVLLVAACNVGFTTAHITGFVISKDKTGTQPTNSFAAADTVYAVTTVANVPDKVTLKWRLIAEKVAGFADNASLPGSELTFELKGDGHGDYSLTPPHGAWPAGTYRIEVSMLDGTAEKDKRSGTFTVAGAAAVPANAPSAAQEGETAASGSEFGEPEFSDSKQGDPADSFTDDTPKIYMHDEFNKVAIGTKITATWIAEKTDAAPPGTTIISSDVSVDSAEENAVDFSLSKPTKGWPSGTYRVDVSVGGKVVSSGHFDIGK
ncbi:MAG TPA: hypothetical protein VL425_02880 [Rudaea sp.]|nr:hypothetical protein [Rudaea sp.]